MSSFGVKTLFLNSQSELSQHISEHHVQQFCQVQTLFSLAFILKRCMGFALRIGFLSLITWVGYWFHLSCSRTHIGPYMGLNPLTTCSRGWEWRVHGRGEWGSIMEKKKCSIIQEKWDITPLQVIGCLQSSMHPDRLTQSLGPPHWGPTTCQWPLLYNQREVWLLICYVYVYPGLCACTCQSLEEVR